MCLYVYVYVYMDGGVSVFTFHDALHDFHLRSTTRAQKATRTNMPLAEKVCLHATTKDIFNYIMLNSLVF